VPSSEHLPEEVEHPLFGRGKVVRTRWGGTELLVQFRGVPIWLKRSSLIYAEPEQIAKPPERVPRPAAPRTLSPGILESVRARRFIDSLRLGTVDPERVHEFIFGRENELEHLDNALAKFESLGGYSVSVEGEYGTGKSHLLEHLYQQYLREGYGVSKVEFGLQDVSPAKPRTVYREIVRTLRYMDDQGRIMDFQDLFLQTASRASRVWQSHQYYGRAIQLFDFIRARAPEDSELVAEFWNWLHGEITTMDKKILGRYNLRRPMPSMYDSSTAANVYCYLISGLGVALRAIGRKGLILLMDEEERVENLPTPYQTTLGQCFVEGLSKSLCGGNTDNLPRSGWASSIPYRYGSERTWTMVFFGSATSRDVEKLVKERIELHPLSKSDYEKMVWYLVGTYREAYPAFQIPLNFVSWVMARRLDQRGPVRLFVRTVIESLDVLRCGSARNLEELVWETG